MELTQVTRPSAGAAMDLERAKEILTACAKIRETDADADWLREIATLYALIEQTGESRTILAALGTAILAKSTDPDLWAFSLKADAEFEKDADIRQ